MQPSPCPSTPSFSQRNTHIFSVRWHFRSQNATTINLTSVAHRNALTAVDAILRRPLDGQNQITHRVHVPVGICHGEIHAKAQQRILLDLALPNVTIHYKLSRSARLQSGACPAPQRPAAGAAESGPQRPVLAGQDPEAAERRKAIRASGAGLALDNALRGSVIKLRESVNRAQDMVAELLKEEAKERKRSAKKDQGSQRRPTSGGKGKIK